MTPYDSPYMLDVIQELGVYMSVSDLHYYPWRNSFNRMFIYRGKELFIARCSVLERSMRDLPLFFSSDWAIITSQALCRKLSKIFIGVVLSAVFLVPSPGSGLSMVLLVPGFGSVF